MNNSYRIIQQRLFEQYGSPADLNEVAVMLKTYLSNKVASHRIHGQLVNNQLLGMNIDVQLVDQAIIGESIITREGKMLRTGKCDNVGYSGHIHFRLDKEIENSPSELFAGSLSYIGTGGYSTWNGPWNATGRRITELESGVPHNLRLPFAAYAFGFQFYLSDFPNLDQYALMQKLSDAGMPKNYKYFWQVPDLEARDKGYINYLEDYRSKISHDT